MKKNIVILGSTGSIGKNLLSIIKKDKKNFNIKILSTNKNITKIVKQAKDFKVKKIIISNNKKFLIAKEKYKKLDIKFYNSFSILDKIFKKKEIYYSMISIIGLDGLKPSLQLIKYSKNIAIVNKESIICGWNLIKKRLVKFKTNFIPIDSEHFSIYSLIQNKETKNIDRIFITASGGPFLKKTIRQLKYVKKKDALNHPNWKMGKKISVDSATMMNKVFEVIEAQRIFNIDINKFKILIHPKSYVHAIVKFTNGLTKILVHDTDMKIPIFNSIYSNNNKKIKSSKINLSILNNLNFIKINSTRFPSIKILKMIPNKISLYETIMVSANDQLVGLFLDGKINFSDVTRLLKKIMKMNIFMKYKKRTPKNLNELINLSKFVRLKTNLLSVRSIQ